MRIISILVENNAGSLTRITSLFARRGYNIDTLTVSTTENNRFSRITITADVDDKELRQIITQTEKLIEVHSVEELVESDTVLREIVLVKVACNNGNRSKVKGIADIYKGVIVDLSPNSMVVEVTGKPNKIDAFMRVIGEFNILEVCRTGVTGMKRI